jgi:hypothetical protein
MLKLQKKRILNIHCHDLHQMNLSNQINQMQMNYKDKIQTSKITNP